MAIPPVVGEIRPSQLMFSFGVGAGIDLPHLSVMVLGLDDWDVSHLQGSQIAESRLLAAVREVLGPQVQHFYSAPAAEKDNKNLFGPQPGVPVASFPRWLRCPKCDRLASISSGLFRLKTDPARPEKSRYVHENCGKFKTPPTAVPARFLVACAAGHVDDFPWNTYVHRGKPCSEGDPVFKLIEVGISGGAAGVLVECERCNARRSMADAFGRESDLSKQCSGRHPHLKLRGEECIEPQQTILLGASNSWFPVVLSTFAIPTEDNRLALLVEENWATLEVVTSQEVLTAFRMIGKLKDFAEFDDDALMDAIERRRTNKEETQNTADLKLPEWQILSQAGDAKETNDFKLRIVAPPTGYEDWITQTVLVEKLREVHALVGFTRIASPNDWGEVSDMQQKKIARLKRTEPTWVPSSEVRGEGIFLNFNESKIDDWVNQNVDWENNFFRAHRAWRAQRHLPDLDIGFPGLRYVLLHSLSHALMRQICLQCGYNAASIRERIYARSALSDGGPMAGILIYTAAPDSQGTLGGLVSLGEPEVLARHLASALGAMEICASDPLCAEHHPWKGGISLHAAACHACLFAPETSCERGNSYLDRGTLVQTMGNGSAPFFPLEMG